MPKVYLIFIMLIFIVGFGCQSQPEQAGQTVTSQYFKSGPQLVKIPIKDSTVADSLINLGMDVIVIEKDYVIARLDGHEASKVQTMAINMETVKEMELVQRLIKVIMNNKSDLRELSDTGIDIWEVKGDTVIAQAFDKYIRQIRNKGFSVEIIEDNIQNVVKKHNQK